ncbi:MAG: hypothetical protein PHV32_10650, partial [Eubacteriales bacterium]|nr:hypothetical protein [Eubacteriales bacterium]
AKNSGRLLFFENEQELTDYRLKNEDGLSKFGNMYSFQELYKNQKKFNFEMTKGSILIFILIMILSLFGMGGYNFLLVINSMRTISILYTYGLSKRKALALCLVSKIILILIPAIISVFISPVLSIYPADISVALGCIAAIVLILASVSLFSIKTINKAEIIYSLNKGD